MQQKIVDLYKYWRLERPEGATGYLTCYGQNVPKAMGVRRLRPAVLVIPGGGYGHVSPREGEPVALRFLARGYCAFVLEYSVAPLRFPTQLREAAMAMAYIRENAESWEVDPAMVAAVGFSAGGHLCGTMGLLFDSPEVADIGTAGQLRPDALGLCYPVAVSWGPTHEGSFDNLCGEDAGLRQRLSLDRLARPDMPPVYLWHTWDDGTVPCRNSLILAKAAQEKGVPVGLRLYLHGSHGISTADEQVYPAGRVPSYSPDLHHWPEEMMGFFEEIGLKIKDLEQSL
jgi:acetyl esterase/lipase